MLTKEQLETGLGAGAQAVGQDAVLNRKAPMDTTAVTAPWTTTPYKASTPSIQEQMDMNDRAAAPERYSRLGSSGISDPNVEAARSALYTVTPFDEAAAKKSALENAQANLDAVNRKYDASVQDERNLGKKNLGRANTISAITGMMGSPTATARAGQTEKQTEKQVAQVNDLRTMALTAIYDKIDQNVKAEKEAALATNRENAANILNKVAQDATEALGGIASQGISWDTFKANDPDALATMIRQTGKSEYALRSQYDKALPEEYRPIVHTDYTDNGDGTTTMRKVSFNPMTKKTNVENYQIAAPISMFNAAEKPIEVDGKLLVRQPDGTYKDVAPHTAEELAAAQADVAYKQSQTEQNKSSTALNYANATKARTDSAKTASETGTPASSVAKSADQIEFMKSTVQKALSPEIYGAAGRSEGRKTLEKWLVGSTDYTNATALANTIRTNILTMATDPAIKKFFGPQMSNNDVTMMTAGGTTLNPELQSPEAFKEELLRVQDMVNRAEAAVKQGQSAESGPQVIILIDPKTKQPMDASSLTKVEYDQAIKDGYVAQ